MHTRHRNTSGAPMTGISSPAQGDFPMAMATGQATEPLPPRAVPSTGHAPTSTQLLCNWDRWSGVACRFSPFPPGRANGPFSRPHVSTALAQVRVCQKAKLYKNFQDSFSNNFPK